MTRLKIAACSIVLGLAIFAAAKSSFSTPTGNSAAIPIPLCPPDQPTCDPGNPGN